MGLFCVIGRGDTIGEQYKAGTENVGTSAQNLRTVAAVAALLPGAAAGNVPCRTRSSNTHSDSYRHCCRTSEPCRNVGVAVGRPEQCRIVRPHPQREPDSPVRPPGFTKDPATYSKVSQTAKLAKCNGIAVYALGGDPSWVSTLKQEMGRRNRRIRNFHRHERW